LFLSNGQMNILGISAFYHDSAAALIQDGKIVAAAQEERFTRKKHDAAFPVNAVKYCLEFSGLKLNDLDAVVFYDKPLLKFERLIETYYSFAPQGVRSFITAMPVWMKEKLFLKREIRNQLSEIEEVDFNKVKLLFPEHHLSHAASTYYPSPYEEAAILTVDGVGEWATASICHGKGKDITILKELKFPNSLGLLYSAFTYFLGFRVNSGEYKLMGLAPYGNAGSDNVKKFKKIITEQLITVFDDGSIHLNQQYFNYAVGLTMTNNNAFEKLFGIKRRLPETELEQVHCDMGLAIQLVTEEIMVKMAAEAKRLTGSDSLCLSGGVALNCVANGKIINEKIFKNVFIQPASGDAGGALGAALAAYHIFYSRERAVDSTKMDALSGSYLGPYYSEKEITQTLKKYDAVAVKYNSTTALADKVAGYLNNEKAIGWVQGRMEFGPRALGARSVIGDARSPEMQKKLNLKVKFRESFRPFAPSVLAEKASEYFNTNHASPYMLEVQNIADAIKKPLPDNYAQLSIRDKLYFQRSTLPAITHVDYSARIQTVHKETNPVYWELLNSFYKLTGCPVIVNTSFNVRGEPIVCTPEDAYRCFMRTNLDVLVLDNFVLLKEEQPQWKETDNWKEEFTLD